MAFPGWALLLLTLTAVEGKPQARRVRLLLVPKIAPSPGRAPTEEGALGPARETPTRGAEEPGKRRGRAKKRGRKNPWRRRRRRWKVAGPRPRKGTGAAEANQLPRPRKKQSAHGSVNGGGR